MEKSKSNELIDEVLCSADLSDRAWMLINKYKKQITLCIATCCVLLAILGLAMVIYNSGINAMKNAFMKLETDEQKLYFANKYKSKQLGGVVFMELADRAYKSGVFDVAADRYNNARISLKNSPPGSRAAIGACVSLIKAGKIDLGKQNLLKLSQDGSAPSSLRAEALMLLARFFQHNKDIKNAAAALEQVISGNFGSNWKAIAEDTRNEMEI
ncbi:MAG: hypothetical protein LBH49_00270 [Puniceicoccales bacterium]|jgi:hypothetical protein|nr:hypothetical protein [Puniceicoccales bacterium]